MPEEIEKLAQVSTFEGFLNWYIEDISMIWQIILGLGAFGIVFALLLMLTHTIPGR